MHSFNLADVISDGVHQLSESGYCLPCPARCEGSTVEDPAHYRILGTTDWERYLRFGAEELVSVALR